MSWVRIRDVSVTVTRGVIRTAQANGVDRELSLRNLDDDKLDEYIRLHMYDPFCELDGLRREMAEFGAPRDGLENGVNGKAESAAHL